MSLRCKDLSPIMKGITVIALFVIAAVWCTDGAPVETEAAASASTAKQPHITPATPAFANPSASAKSSISEHPRHKRRRHHRRRHRLHRHRHKLYPLKDRLQQFVGGTTGATSNLLASVKTPHQDFEMTNGEVFEHGGVPDLSESSPQLIRSLPKYHHIQHKSSLTDRRTMNIRNSSDNSTATVMQNNTALITNDTSTKAKVYWDHTSRLINYLVKSYKDAIDKAPENGTKEITQRDETHNTTMMKNNNGTIHHSLTKPPSNPSPEPDEPKSSNSSYTNKEIQEMKKIRQPEEIHKEPDSKQSIEPKKQVKVEEPIKPASSSAKDNPSPINPDEIDVNDIVTTSNTGAGECDNDDDEACGETGEGEDKVHYDKKTSAKESESQFESAFQNRIDKFVADKTFSAKPLFHLGNEEEDPCVNQDVENNDADTRGTPCITPHRHHHHHYHHHHDHNGDQYYHEPQVYTPHVQQHPKHWTDLNDRHPLQMHLYNNTNDDYPHYGPPTDGSNYDSHDGTQPEFVANTPPLFTSPPASPRLPMGTLGNARPAMYPPVGNVQTPITFGGYTVTGTKQDPQHNQVHLFTGPRQVHLFKAYNTSEISMNTKQQLQQILNKDIQTPHRDMCRGNECSGAVQLAGEGFTSQRMPVQSFNNSTDTADNEGSFHESIGQQPGTMVQMHQRGDMNQGEEIDDGDHGYHDEGVVDRQ